MKKVFTFLPGLRSEKEKEDPSSADKGRSSFKRREQVRKAQRTHRERKEQYVKSLETDVLRLRSSEMNLQVQAEHLHNHIGMLQSILEANGIDYPVAPYDRENPVAVSYETNFASPLSSSENGALSAPSSGAPGVSPEARQENSKNSSSPAELPIGSLSLQKPIGAGLRQWQTSTKRLCDMNLNEVGIEFVLALENPCLPHLEPLPNEGNGHALTASMSLTRLPPAHNHTHQHCHVKDPANGSNQATSESGQEAENPSLIFNSLMKLSHEIILENSRDITPIQAWIYITQQPWSGQIEVRKIKELSEILLQYISCYGFGAVMGWGQFDHSLGHLTDSLQG